MLALVLLGCSLKAQQAPKAPGSSPKAAAAPRNSVSATNSSEVTNGTYRNSAFGFTYKLPFGWVDRTLELADDSSDPKKSILLLSAFERPPGATGETVNSAVVIAAEAASSYPGLQTADQYFGPITELTKSKGFKIVNEPYQYPVGAKQLVRGDFSKPLDNLAMHQSTLVFIEKGYVVSFTFIGGSEDEVDSLVERLSFGKKDPSAAAKTTPPK